MGAELWEMGAKGAACDFKGQFPERAARTDMRYCRVMQSESRLPLSLMESIHEEQESSNVAGGPYFRRGLHEGEKVGRRRRNFPVLYIYIYI